MTPYETDEESQPVDQHTGTRLVILLFLLPLSAVTGLVAWTIVRQLAGPLGHDASQRAGLAAAAVAFAATMILLIRWQYAFSPKSQAAADDEVDSIDDVDDEYDPD